MVLVRHALVGSAGRWSERALSPPGSPWIIGLACLVDHRQVTGTDEDTGTGPPWGNTIDQFPDSFKGPRLAAGIDGDLPHMTAMIVALAEARQQRQTRERTRNSKRRPGSNCPAQYLDRICSIFAANSSPMSSWKK